jgi:hypothetical protein
MPDSTSVVSSGAPSQAICQSRLTKFELSSNLKTAKALALEVPPADALLVHVDALFNDQGGETQIVALAAQHRLPTMMAGGTFPARGGLISYGADTRDLNRRAGVYVARILRGEKPAEPSGSLQKVSDSDAHASSRRINATRRCIALHKVRSRPTSRAPTTSILRPSADWQLQQRATALLVCASPFFNIRRQQLVVLAARHAYS